MQTKVKMAKSSFLISVYFQASQPIFSPPPPPPSTTHTAGPNPTPNPTQTPTGAAEALNPELFTGIVHGVLSSMMGSLGQAQNDTESIAQFMQRLSQATNIFISPEDPTGKEQIYKWIYSVNTASEDHKLWCYSLKDNIGNDYSFFRYSCSQGFLESCWCWCARRSPCQIWWCCFMASTSPWAASSLNCLSSSPRTTWTAESPLMKTLLLVPLCSRTVVFPFTCCLFGTDYPSCNTQTYLKIDGSF